VSRREAQGGHAIPPECLDHPQGLISAFPYLSRLHIQAVFLAKTFTRISISTLPKKSIYFFLFSFGKPLCKPLHCALHGVYSWSIAEEPGI
jgi:hypothetical protein